MASRSRVALVTGGSGEIGRAICARLAQEGAKVAFAYFSDHEGAAATREMLRDHGDSEPTVFRVNFGDAESTAAFVEAVKQQCDPVDVLVHNAASGVFRPAAELTPRHVQWAFDVGVKSLLSLVAGLHPAHLAEGASIVALSSLGAVRAIPAYTAVGASKAALEAAARHLAVELGDRGVRVNVVSPGLVRTKAIDHLPNRDTLLQVALGRTPLRRLARPDDVADVVAFLCSAAARMVSGQTLHVDGGYSIVG